jgi:glycosyltransferase involved in cell wall biosynthesis
MAMNILEISALPIWSMDGKGGMPSLRETLRGHVRNGHDVTVILPRYHLFNDDPTPLIVRHGEGYDVHVAQCRWLPAFKKVRSFARRLGRGGEMPYVLRWGLNMVSCLCLTVSLLLAAARLRRRTGRRFDLVYAHNQYAALAGWLLGLAWGSPNVTRLYGTFLADLMNRPLVTLRYPVLAAGYRVPSDLLICANDGTRGDEVARKFGTSPERFRFWQNGVDPPETPPAVTRKELAERLGCSIDPSMKWVVTCSRLSYWKRIDRILRAVAVAVEKGGDLRMIIAGDGDKRPELETLAAELGIDEYVIWLGAVAHEEIWSLMHVADAFIITNDVTNRCNPIYEAICARLPIVTVADQSTQDLLKHEENAMVAEKDDHETLGSHLAKVCDDADLNAKLRDGQDAVAARMWSWEERMDAEVSELESLVKAGRKRANHR